VHRRIGPHCGIVRWQFVTITRCSAALRAVSHIAHYDWRMRTLGLTALPAEGWPVIFDSLGPADGPDFPAPSPSAEELIASIGLEPRNKGAGRHLETLQDLSGPRIDSPQITVIAFPGSVPEISVDPGDSGDEAIGFDGAKNGPGLRIDLMDFPVPVLPHPERPFGPRQARVTAVARSRDRGENAAALRIDLLDAILAELVQMLTVEGRSGMRGDIDRAQYLAALRIEGVQLVACGKPNPLTVIRDSTHAVGARKGTIFTNNLGG
jgi:hypothetical protein